MYMCKYKKETK